MEHASLFETAVQAHRAGKIERAELLYRRVIEQAPKHGDAMFLLSMLVLGSNRLEEACALLERAVRVAPNPLFLSNLGGVYGRLGRQREALGALFMAIARKPDFTEPVVTLGSRSRRKSNCLPRQLAMSGLWISLQTSRRPHSAWRA